MRLRPLRNYTTIKLGVLLHGIRAGLRLFRNYTTLKPHGRALTWANGLRPLRNYTTLKPHLRKPPYKRQRAGNLHFVREPLNKSAAALSGSFAPTFRFENLEIRKGFLQFSNLNLEQNPSLTALAIESEVPSFQLAGQLHIIQNALQIISIVIQNSETGRAKNPANANFITGNGTWQVKRELLNKLFYFAQQSHCADVIPGIQRFRLQPGLQLGNQRLFSDLKGKKPVKRLCKPGEGNRHNYSSLFLLRVSPYTPVLDSACTGWK